MVEGWRIEAPGVAVELLPPTFAHLLRLRPADREAALAARALAPFRALKPNEAVGEAPRLAWIAPGEWLVTGAAPRSEWLRALARTPAFHNADLSHGRIRFVVSGHGARDLLAKACTIDLHPRIFGVGRCALTIFAQVQVLIDQISDRPVFHLYADISHQAHLTHWFEDAALEFRFEGNRSCRSVHTIS